jgi:hypothetical protein
MGDFMTPNRFLGHYMILFQQADILWEALSQLTLQQGDVAGVITPEGTSELARPHCSPCVPLQAFEFLDAKRQALLARKGLDGASVMPKFLCKSPRTKSR